MYTSILTNKWTFYFLIVLHITIWIKCVSGVLYHRNGILANLSLIGTIILLANWNQTYNICKQLYVFVFLLSMRLFVIINQIIWSSFCCLFRNKFSTKYNKTLILKQLYCSHGVHNVGILIVKHPFQWSISSAKFSKNRAIPLPLTRLISM